MFLKQEKHDTDDYERKKTLILKEKNTNFNII